jgi:hypothetical protein
MDRTRPCPSRGGSAPRGQRWDGFDFFEFGPPKTGPYRPYRTVNRPTRRPSEFISDRTVCKSLDYTDLGNLELRPAPYGPEVKI